MKKTIVISGIARTAIGSFQGSLKDYSATQLGTYAISGLLNKYNISKDDVEMVVMGEVISTGEGQAPARQAAIGSGLSFNTPCATINKVCGSGLYSVILAQQNILLEENKTIVAGGMESMSNIPYFIKNIRTGFRMGDNKIIDGMFHDGLYDPYNNELMGKLTDACAEKYEITRLDQDNYSEASYLRTLNAISKKYYKDEIIPININKSKKNIIFCIDEEPNKFMPEKIARLKPAFSKNGTVTAFNSSKISDGAAAVLVMDKEESIKKDIKPLVEIIATDIYADNPKDFPSAPYKSISRLLKKTNLNIENIDLFEINEAFSVVPIIAMKKLNIPHEKINIHGGAISLGHPLGCSGTRILVSLINSMHMYNLDIGCASICLGGGEAISMILKRAS